MPDIACPILLCSASDPEIILIHALLYYLVCYHISPFLKHYFSFLVIVLVLEVEINFRLQ